MNRKVYKTPEENIDAIRQAIELRQKWENAIREGLSRDGGDRFKVTENCGGIIKETRCSLEYSSGSIR